MKLNTLLTVALVSLAEAAPVKEEKRQLNGLLSSLGGVLGANQSFDYIVLGGGTGGLTIAKRLAEDPSVSVAVIEAGSVYEVTDPVLESTPGGDVSFVGRCSHPVSKIYDPEVLTSIVKGPVRLCQRLIGGLSHQRTQLQTISGDHMLEESV
jgi:hypothetical protein